VFELLIDATNEISLALLWTSTMNEELVVLTTVSATLVNIALVVQNALEVVVVADPLVFLFLVCAGLLTGVRLTVTPFRTLVLGGESSNLPSLHVLCGVALRAQPLMDAFGLEPHVTTAILLATTPVAPTPQINAFLEESSNLPSLHVLCGLALRAQPLMDAFGLEPRVTTVTLLATTLVAPTPQINALLTIPQFLTLPIIQFLILHITQFLILHIIQFLILHIIQFLILPITQFLTILPQAVNTIPTVSVASPILPACGIQTRLLIANPRSNVTLPTAN
jgi:hypothetical protein